MIYRGKSGAEPDEQDEFKTEFKLTDVGTRYDHLRDLLTLWKDGIEILKPRVVRYKLDSERTQLKTLGSAAILLQKHLDAMADFSDGQYKLSQSVNALAPDVKALLLKKTKKGES